MRYTRLAFVYFVLASSLFDYALATDNALFPWSERGVFVFSGIVLDFWKGVEVSKPYVTSGLVNCSTANYYCAFGDIIHVVLPRHCELLNQKKWSVSTMETEVLATLDDPEAATSVHPWGSGKLLLLGDGIHTNVVYEYDPIRGVRGFYWDSLKSKNLAEIVRAGNTKEIAELDKNVRYYELVSLDPFGKCER
jgi:hypothetical protein